MIKLENISKYYHEENTVVKGLSNINLNFEIGEFVAITGESGCGKTTLLNVISGIDTYEDGEMYVNGDETSYFSLKDWEEYRKKYIAFIFQNYNLIDSYTVIQNVMVSLLIKGEKKSDAQKRALKILEKVGLLNYKNHKATKLSGGQKQRLAIARALAKDTKVIVADEPTGNLDSESGKSIIKLLNQISKDKLVIIVTHNYEEVEEFVTRKIRLFDGRVIEDRYLDNKKPIEDTQDDDNIIDNLNTKKTGNVKKALRFATWNLLGQPKRTIFMTIIAFMMTLFTAFFLILYVNIYEINEGLEYTTYFTNDYEERIVISKKDESVITQDDINKLKNIKGINDINTFDYLLDYAYYVERLEDNYFYNKLNLLTQDDIVFGRFPEKGNEVVISSNISLETFKNKVYEEKILIFDEEYVVTGITKANYGKNNTIFVDEQTYKKIYGLDKSNRLLNDGIIAEIVDEDEHDYYNIYFGGYLFPLEGLEDDQIVASNNFYKDYLNYNYPINLIISEYSFKVANKNVLIDVSKLKTGLYISQNMYNKIIFETKQASISLENASLIDDTKTEINNLGFYYVVPSEVSVKIDMGYVIYNFIFFFISCFMALLFIFLVGYFVLKTILLSKKKDYSILQSLGFNKKIIFLISKFELIITFIISFLIFLLIFIIVKNTTTIITLTMILDNISIIQLLFVFIINILLSLLVSRKYNKLLMKKSLVSNMKES